MTRNRLVGALAVLCLLAACPGVRAQSPQLAYFHGSSPGVQSVTVQVWNPSSYNLCSVYTNPPTGPNGVLYPNGRFFSIGVAPVKFVPPDAAGNFSVSMMGTFVKGPGPGVPALGVIRVAPNGNPDPTKAYTAAISIFAVTNGKVGQLLLQRTAIGWKM